MKVLSVERIPVKMPNSQQMVEMTVITALESQYGIVQDYISDDILSHRRFFEEEEVGRVIAELSPGDLFVDVGANIGTFTVAAQAVGATTISIEPQPILQKTLKKNAGKGEIHAVGAGTSKDKLHIYTCFTRHPDRHTIIANLGGNSLLNIGGRTDSGVEVEIKTLDEIVGNRSPKVIKIDVEEMEADVIKSGLKMIERCKPVIYAENNSGDAIVECFNILKPLGYKITDVIGELGSSTVVRYAC